MSDRFWAWGALPHSALVMLVAAALAIPSAAQAQIYTWKDANGNIHYSDIPASSRATKVETGPADTVRNPNFNQALMRKSVPYRDVGGQMHVEGQVDGVSVDFVVDTGASMVVIPRTVADQAGISTEGAASISIQTANGIVDAPVVKLDSFDLGSLHVDGISAVVHNIDAGGQMGLLGMNFLSAYRMTIDHEHHVLILDAK
jgi:clan AA aspartic protease (TIGR02281 family)